MVADGKDLHHDTLYHLGIALPDKAAVVDAYHRAVEIGAHVEKPPRTTWKGTPLHELWLTDPDGTLIEVCARLTPEELAGKPADEAPEYLVSRHRICRLKEHAMLECRVSDRRIDSHGSEATTKEARIALDTDMAGRAGGCIQPGRDAAGQPCRLNPEGDRAGDPNAPVRAARAHSQPAGVRHDSPPKMLRIDYEIVVDSGETDARLNILHKNLQKYGTIHNTLADATELSGTIRRKD